MDMDMDQFTDGENIQTKLVQTDNDKFPYAIITRDMDVEQLIGRINCPSQEMAEQKFQEMKGKTIMGSNRAASLSPNDKVKFIGDFPSGSIGEQFKDNGAVGVVIGDGHDPDYVDFDGDGPPSDSEGFVNVSVEDFSMGRRQMYEFMVPSKNLEKVAMKKKAEVKATYVREDDQNRGLYKGDDGNIYVDVEGVLYEMTDEGEPLYPATGVEKNGSMRKSATLDYGTVVELKEDPGKQYLVTNVNENGSFDLTGDYDSSRSRAALNGVTEEEVNVIKPASDIGSNYFREISPELSRDASRRKAEENPSDDNSSDEDSEVSNPSAQCPACGGTGVPLGQMGKLTWYRCEGCGMDFNEKMALKTAGLVKKSEVPTGTDYKLEEFHWHNPGTSGTVYVSTPDPEADGGTNDIADNFIIYDDGTIAFDNWHDDKMNDVLCGFINAEKSKLGTTASKKTASGEDFSEGDMVEITKPSNPYDGMVGRVSTVFPGTGASVYFHGVNEHPIIFSYGEFEMTDKDASVVDTDFLKQKGDSRLWTSASKKTASEVLDAVGEPINVNDKVIDTETDEAGIVLEVGKNDVFVDWENGRQGYEDGSVLLKAAKVKTAWNPDASDITPNAKKIMDAYTSVSTEADFLARFVADGCQPASDEDLEGLEDYNYHTCIKILTMNDLVTGTYYTKDTYAAKKMAGVIMNAVQARESGNGLVITISPEGQEELKQIQNDDPDRFLSDDLLWDVLEPIWTNAYPMVSPSSIGALTEAPMLTSGDPANITDADKIFWYPGYESRSPLQDLLENGTTTFQNASQEVTAARKTASASDVDFEKFVKDYAVCALWSSMDNSDENTGGNPLDDNYGINDISPDTMSEMRSDCQDFIAKVEAANILTGGMDADASEARANEEAFNDRGGHDFWLTRNGHGAGFWDGHYDKETGDKLSEIARGFGEYNLYIGDDGKIHG